jgi:spermidine/putrescine transport system substrate-binding protein
MSKKVSNKENSSPEVRAIVDSQVSRRTLFAGAGGIGVASLLGLNLSEASAATTGGTVRWANWGYYIDFDEKTNKYPTIEAFTKKTGIKVTYQEAIDDNDTFTAKVSPQLKLKKDIGYDLVTPTEWMAARWIASGFTTKFNVANIPNKKNVIDILANRPLDPKREQTLPYAGIIAGIAWNKKKVPGGFQTMDQVFDKKYKGKRQILVLSEMRDTIGLIMMWQGVDIAGKFTEAQFMNAVNKFEQLVKDGYIGQIKGQSYAQDLQAGNVSHVIGWSGDIAQLNLQVGSDQFGFAVPDSGGTFSSDNFMIPSTAKNQAGAEALINYYYDPAVAARLSAYINYVCPVKGAQDEMAKFNAKQAKNPLIFPTAATFSKLHVFRGLTPAEQLKFSTAFQKVSGNG